MHAATQGLLIHPNSSLFIIIVIMLTWCGLGEIRSSSYVASFSHWKTINITDVSNDAFPHSLKSFITVVLDIIQKPDSPSLNDK